MPIMFTYLSNVLVNQCPLLTLGYTTLAHCMLNKFRVKESLGLSFYLFSHKRYSFRTHNVHINRNFSTWTTRFVARRRFGTSKMHLSPPVA